MKHAKRWGAALLAALLILALTACGGSKGTDNQLVMYEGNFSEMKLIQHMVKMLVEANTDLTVEIKDEMTSVNMWKELTAKEPSCDLMNSYDGTLLTTYLKLDPDDVPQGMSLYDFANEQGEKQYGVRLLDKLGNNNTYAIAVPQDIADQYGLKTVSDLIPVADQLIFGAEHEFFTEEGSMKYGPFVKFYGLDFKDSVSVDLGLKYAAVENGSFQVTEVYATDGLNRKAKLKVLEDDRQFFPEYNDAILIREDVLEKFKDTAPNLEDVLNLLGGQFTNESMTDLTYAVDVEGKDVDDVAHAFLIQQGLLSE
jgi:glycine betaine/choline ABC-type transport system substrate-binding protein